MTDDHTQRVAAALANRIEAAGVRWNISKPQFAAELAERLAPAVVAYGETLVAKSRLVASATVPVTQVQVYTAALAALEGEG